MIAPSGASGGDAFAANNMRHAVSAPISGPVSMSAAGEPFQVEGARLFEDPGQGLSQMLDHRRAFFGACRCRVAGHTRRVEIAAFPSKGRRAVGCNRLPLHRLAERYKILRLVHAHEIGTQVQHHRRFDCTPV